MTNNYPGKSGIRKRCRELRKNGTDAEQVLWKYLRNRNLSGYKILRQHPIIYNANQKATNYFISDFYCDSKKTVIELDGPIHNERIEYDKFRDDEMRFLGLNVLRIRNEELSDIEKNSC